MANKAAGEMEIIIDGTTYTLRPSFQAIMDFEEKAGTTAFEAVRAAGERQSIPIKSMVAAFHAGIKAAWKPAQGQLPTFDQIGAAVRKDGQTAHLQSYLTFIVSMITGEKALADAEKQVAEGKA